MSAPIRLLIVDGYPKASRRELMDCGAGTAGDLYVKMLDGIMDGLATRIVYPTDTGAGLPKGMSLADFDGIAWTGCNLNVHDGSAAVKTHLDLAGAALEAGIPAFGSCFGAQLAVTATGGEVRVNPRGREMGIARKISLTDAGRAHPMFAGRNPAFEAFISHNDEIVTLGPDALHLAGNVHTPVQAVAVSKGKGTFWAVQYHPELDLHEMARLISCRFRVMVRQGYFRDAEAGMEVVDLMETLHGDPKRKDIAWMLGIDGDVTDAAVRTNEVGNWLKKQVVPALNER